MTPLKIKKKNMVLKKYKMSLMKLLFLNNLNFPMVVTIITFFEHVTFFSLNEDSNVFISFLCLDHGHNIMTNNSLSIHIESGNIFYQKFNKNENFYSFLLAQQDETKAIIPKRIANHYSFEKYVRIICLLFL